MSDRAARAVGDVVGVLVVGEGERADAATDALASGLGDRSVVRARTVPEALDVLDERDVRCVVAEFDGDDPSPFDRIRAADAGAAAATVALADDADAAAAVDAGADDVLGPDDPPAVVVARVGNAAERRRLAVERGETVAARAVLAAAAATVLVVDADGEVRYASPGIEADLGYTPDEVERRPLARFVHPDDRDDADDAREAAVEGGTGARTTGRLRLSRADGTWRVAGVTYANRLADPAVSGVVVTVGRPGPSPADERRDALDRLDAGVLALGPDWEVVDANAAASRLLGRPAGDLAGTVVWDLLPEPARETVYDRFHEARETGASVAFEVAFPPVDGRLAVEAFPGEGGVSVLLREAPDEDARVRGYRERAEDVEAVLDALDVGVVVVDGATIERANARLVEWSGADAVAGRDATALFDADAVAAIRERAASPVVRRGDPVEADLATDDGTRAVEVGVVPLSDGERAVCVVRDAARRSAATATALGDLARALRDAGTETEACRRVADAARDGLAADVVGCYAARGGEFRPVAVAARDGEAVDLPTVAREGTPLDRALDRGDVAVHDGAALDAFAALAGGRPGRALTAPVDGDLVLFATTAGRGSADADRAFVAAATAVAGVALDRIEREGRLERRELDLSRADDRLDRLRALGERTRAVGRVLADADSREAAERGVCDALADLDWVDLAWIGAVGADDEVTVRAAAGATDYLDAVSVSLAADPDAEPAGRAAATGEPAVVDAVVRTARDRAWRRVALDRGIRSALAAPIASDGHVYGVLGVYADRPLAFDADVEAALASLGTTVAHGIAAIERKRALVAETAIELEFVGRDLDDPLSALARESGARLDLRAVVPRSPGGWSIFAATAGDVDAIREAAADLDAVDALSVVERDDDAVLELVASGSTLVETLADRGAALRSIAADADETRFVVDVASDTDVGSLVRHLERVHPGTDLRARRERERPVRTRRSFDAAVRERLTDRQFRALEAAYYGGFFEWPRERTGEEVAASLGVSQPTFNRHLRAAERKLYALLFEGDGGPDSGR